MKLVTLYFLLYYENCEVTAAPLFLCCSVCYSAVDLTNSYNWTMSINYFLLYLWNLFYSILFYSRFKRYRFAVYCVWVSALCYMPRCFLLRHLSNSVFAYDAKWHQIKWICFCFCFWNRIPTKCMEYKSTVIESNCGGLNFTHPIIFFFCLRFEWKTKKCIENNE